MRITIEAETATDIRTACMEIADALRTRPGKHARPMSEKVKRISAQRMILRRAFDLIRYDPTQKKTVDWLAKGIGCTMPITLEMMDAARWIIANRAEGK